MAKSSKLIKNEDPLSIYECIINLKPENSEGLDRLPQK
jgi:hypothetical protein